METGEESEGEEPRDELNKITKREKEVILLINQGKSNKEIAHILQISENTVKNHISNIFAKLNINDRSQLPSLFKDESAGTQKGCSKTWKTVQ